MRKAVNAVNLGKDAEEFSIGDTEFEMSIRYPSGNIKIGSWIYESGANGNGTDW